MLMVASSIQNKQKYRTIPVKVLYISLIRIGGAKRKTASDNLVQVLTYCLIKVYGEYYINWVGIWKENFYKKRSSSFCGFNNNINGVIEHSVLGNNITIEEGAHVINSVIFDSCVIKKGVTVKNAMISEKQIVENDFGSDDNVSVLWIF